MTVQQLAKVAGYLANPARHTTLELEIPAESIIRYRSIYEAHTRDKAFPKRTKHVYVIPKGGNKWGREMRIYFNADNTASVPPQLTALASKSNRPGYEQYNRRVNNNELIDRLIEDGFILGSIQDPARIRGRMPVALRKYFDQGFVL